MKLTACSDLSAADWITGSDLPWQQLAGFGPSGFTAYARLRFLPDPAYDGQSENDVDFGDAVSESAKLSAALQVLSRHTSTPDAYYFCLWDGWGWDDDSAGSALIDIESGSTLESMSTSRLPKVYREDGSPHAAARPGVAPSSPSSVHSEPKVVIPNRAYFLFQVSEVGDRDLSPGRLWPDLPDPAFIWPADRAWCLANDVDPHWAGIGADASAIDNLVADPRLDVVPADPRLSPAELPLAPSASWGAETLFG